MKRNKTNAIEALQELLRKYSDGDEFPHSRNYCPLCIYNDAVSSDGHRDECIACPYNIPDVKVLIPQRRDWYKSCIGWINKGSGSLDYGTPGRIEKIKEILALCKKLPASCFKELAK